MGRFADNFSAILEVAESAAAGGHDLPDWSILVGLRGAIQMVADSDWSLESLQAERGARMAFRVSRHDGRVCLTGRAGDRSCRSDAGKPNGVARLLPAAVAAYPVI